MPTPWQLSLQPASWRGVRFAVRGSNRRGGRRIAVHEYPFRDDPWPEDIGRGSRYIAFSGFVIGDDAGDQAENLITACEQKGTGSLVHPIYGLFSAVTLLTFETEERWDQGRVVEFKFTFIKGGLPVYPTAAADTQAATQTSAVAAANTNVDTSATNDQSITANSGGFNTTQTIPQGNVVVEQIDIQPDFTSTAGLPGEPGVLEIGP